MQKLIGRLSVESSGMVAGLDVGSSKVCLVIADHQPGGRVEIIGESLQKSKQVDHGIVTDIDEVGEVIAQALERAQMVAGAQISSVYVGVSGEHLKSVLSSGKAAISNPTRVIRREDVERAVSDSRSIVTPGGDEIIQTIVRDYSVDHQNRIKAPVNMSGSLLEAHSLLVHGTGSYIQNLGRSVERAGLAVDEYVLMSHADALAVLTAEDREMGVAVVDIGYGTIDVACYKGGSILFSGVLPFGGQHITQDVAVGLQCALLEAERVKIDSGSAKESALVGDEFFSFRRLGASDFISIPKALLVEMIQPRVVEMLQMVKELLDTRPEEAQLPAGIVLTGGTSSLRGLLPVAESVFKAPCRIGAILNARGLGEVAATRSHVGAVGLALYGAEQTQTTLRPASRGVGGLLSKFKDAFSSAEA